MLSVITGVLHHRQRHIKEFVTLFWFCFKAEINPLKKTIRVLGAALRFWRCKLQICTDLHIFLLEDAKVMWGMDNELYLK